MPWGAEWVQSTTGVRTIRITIRRFVEAVEQAIANAKAIGSKAFCR